MPSPPGPSDLTPAERTRAIARVLAAGLLRLAELPLEPPPSQGNPAAKKSLGFISELP
jgi:hypothetical protein